MQCSSRFKGNKFSLFFVVLIFILILSACSKGQNTPTPPSKIAASPSATIVNPTQLPTSDIPSTPTLIPTAALEVAATKNSMIVFAMGTGGYRHLFAFHPNYLPITQLSTGNWDDSDPALSPDGNWLVFTSNRSGEWDIYLWDLLNNSIQQITNSPDVETSPDWSPDNQWITYSSNNYLHSNIIIRSITDLATAPIQLTEGVGNNIDPAWSPLGRQIAFSTDRSGRFEIWLAQLDTADNRFSIVAGGQDADFVHPSWSPEGTKLAWEKTTDISTIQVWNLTDDPNLVTSIATGKLPFWSPDGSILMTRFDTPDQYYLNGYSVQTGGQVYPMIALPAKTSPFHWSDGNSYQNVNAILSTLENPVTAPICQPGQSILSSASGRLSLVTLDTVVAPDPLLSDSTDECFALLRTTIATRIGWDLLRTLNNAALPITTSPDPGIPQNWLYTGRAIALNTAPLDAGWMAVSREDYEGQVFWRVWVKCLQQDGSCGEFIDQQVWDFAARASGDLVAFENGGKTITPPSGYWVDFTDLAQQLGWQRLPSLNNWRSYYPGILFNTFVYQQGKSWRQAMLELYPEDIIPLVEPGK